MKKILIVDDDPNIVEVVTLILELNGFDVVTHTTGYNVPQVIKDVRPDLVLLDINLPGNQGTTICSELKAKSKVPPILLFSAHANEGDTLNRCMADGFIKKPFDITHLVDMVNAHSN